MPPKGSKKKQEPEYHNFCEDTVADGVLLYPVFCTADIPLEILDEYIAQANEGAVALIPGDCGAVLCDRKYIEDPSGSRETPGSLSS